MKRMLFSVLMILSCSINVFAEDLTQQEMDFMTRMAKDCVEDKNYDQAEQIWLDIIEKYPNTKYHMWALKDLICIHTYQKNKTIAQSYLDDLIVKFIDHEDFVWAYFDSAKSYSDMHEYKKAAQMYQNIINEYGKLWKNDDFTRWATVLYSACLAMDEIDQGNFKKASEIAVEMADRLKGYELLDQYLFTIAFRIEKNRFYDYSDAVYTKLIEYCPGSLFIEKAGFAFSKLSMLNNIENREYKNVFHAAQQMAEDYKYNPNLSETLNYIARECEIDREYNTASNIYQLVIDFNLDTNQVYKAEIGIKKSEILSLVKDGRIDLETGVSKIKELIDIYQSSQYLPEAVYVIAEGYYRQAAMLGFTKDEQSQKKLLELGFVTLKEVLNQVPSGEYTPAIYHFLIQFSKKVGDYPNAIEYSCKMVDGFPDYKHAAFVQFQIGQCFEIMANSGEIDSLEGNKLAKEAYEKYLKNYPDYESNKAQATASLGFIELKTGNAAKAIAHFETIEKEYSSQLKPEVLYCLAGLYENSGLMDKAIQSYKKCLDATPVFDSRYEVIKNKYKSLIQ